MPHCRCGCCVAALCLQLREDAASITGSCENGVCVCANGYGCAGCHINGNTELSYLSEPWGTIDVCTNPFGGGLCTDDAECGNGLCLSGKCVCYSGWTCEYCQLGVNEDIRNHAQCGDYSTGSGSCTTNDDCGGDSHGLCNAGECLCTPGYVCTDCSADRDNVLADLSSCPCKTGQCSGHGTCSNGICTCEENYTGATPCSRVVVPVALLTAVACTCVPIRSCAQGPTVRWTCAQAKPATGTAHAAPALASAPVGTRALTVTPEAANAPATPTAVCSPPSLALTRPTASVTATSASMASTAARAPPASACATRASRATSAQPRVGAGRRVMKWHSKILTLGSRRRFVPPRRRW